jgi:hypothetical protein
LGERRRGLPFVPSPVIADRVFAASLAKVMRDLDWAIEDLQLGDALSGIADALLRHADTGGIAVVGRKTDQLAIRRTCDFLQAHSDHFGRTRKAKRP